MSGAPSALLVFEWHHLGDAVMAIPFVRGAMATRRVEVVCRPGVEEVFRLVLPEGAVHGWTPPWERGGWCTAREGMRKLGGGRFGTMVSAWADARVGILMRLLGGRERIGFPMNAANYLGAMVPWRARLLGRGEQLEWWAERCMGKLYDRPLQRPDPMQHRLADWKQIAAAAGVECVMVRPWWPAQTDSRQGVVICCGARNGLRDWVGNHVGDLVRALAPGHDRIRVVFGPGPVRQVAGAEVLSGLSIREFASLLSGARVVVANDSFAAHLADAAGARVVTVFGPGDPRWFAPGARSEGVISEPRCEYHPCLDVCRKPRMVCFDAVTIDRVVEAVAAAGGTKG